MMNYQPIFFYPYPTYRNDNDKKENMSSNYEFFPLSEAFAKGNLFTNQFEPYLNYSPYIMKPTDNKNQAMLEIQELTHAAHDLTLWLDIYPLDKVALDKFKSINATLKEKLKNYNATFSVLNPREEQDKATSFSYEKTKSPWLR